MNFRFLLDKVIHEILTRLFIEIRGLIAQKGDSMSNGAVVARELV